MEDDTPQLSPEALKALREFFSEQEQKESIDESGVAGNNPFAENWQLSQFWYSTETADILSKEIAAVAADECSNSIACIACPTLFYYMKQHYPSLNCHLLEYDKRFESWGNFSFYDYNEPDKIQDDLKGRFSIVVADPPYLSEECLVKTLKTARILARTQPTPHYYLLTGAVMRDLAYREMQLKPVVFRPVHSQKLGNEFLLYCNQDTASDLGGWDNELLDSAT